MDMAVKGQKRLPLLDEAADGNAADMQVEGHVFHHLSVVRHPIQIRLIRRSVEQEDRIVEIPFACQRFEILLDGRVLDLVHGARHRPTAFLR
jgi:hypothetical protein